MILQQRSENLLRSYHKMFNFAPNNMLFLMKKTLFPTIIASLLLSACNPVLKENTPSNLDGHWLNKEYLDALQGNHSPKQVAENQTFYATELVFEQKKGDSLFVFNGQVEFSNLPIKRYGDTLRLKLNQDAQTAIIYSATNKTLSFTDSRLNRVFTFVRADSSLIDKSYTPKVAFPAAVNKATFEGYWQMFEHLSVEKSATFDKFGNIKGWDKYNNYTVCVNGDCADNEDGDVIFFGNKTKSDQYGFRSKGDTITVFELKQINDADEKPVYRHGLPLVLLVKKTPPPRP